MKTTTVLLLVAGAGAACYFLYLRPKPQAEAAPSPPAQKPAPGSPVFVPGVLDETDLRNKAPNVPPGSLPGIPNLLPQLPFDPFGGGKPPPPGSTPANAGQSPELLALLNLAP